MKYNKHKSYFKIFSILFVILFSFSVSDSRAFATNSNAGEFTFRLSATQQGQPAVQAPIVYENVQIAYENIMNGVIPQNLEKTVLWNTSLAANQSVINLGGGLQIGQGVTHSSEEAKKIIPILFQSNFEIFQYLNDAGSTAINRLPSLLTNDSGQGDGQASKGLVAIISQNLIINLTDLTEDNQQISVNLDGNEAGLSFEFTDLPKTSQNQSGSYVIENNKKIAYKIKISKELLTAPGQTLRILTPPNVVINSSSVPLEKKSLIPSVIPQSYYQGLDVTGENQELLLPQVSAATAESLKKNWSDSNEYILPQSNEDFIITGDLSVTPNVTVNANFLFDDTSELTTPIVLHSFGMQDGSNVKQPTSFQVTVRVGEGPAAVNVSSSPLTSAGINFVMMDGEKNELVKGAKYVLGKKDGNKYYISSIAGWKEVEQKDLTSLNPKEYFVMSGGNVYNYGESEAIPMSVDPQNWDKDFRGLQTRNQSLLGIRGLGQGNQYFIMQVAAPKGYNKIEQPTYFTVHNDKDNPEKLNNSNSIGFASKQSYGLNGQLPGYVAGTNEFNVLSVTPSTAKLKINVTMNIILPIAVMVLVIILTGLLFIWKF